MGCLFQGDRLHGTLDHRARNIRTRTGRRKRAKATRARTTARAGVDFRTRRPVTRIDAGRPRLVDSALRFPSKRSPGTEQLAGVFHSISPRLACGKRVNKGNPRKSQRSGLTLRQIARYGKYKVNINYSANQFEGIKNGL